MTEVSASDPESLADLTICTTRMEYCMRLYNSEEELKENLDKKTQFYFSIVTVILGAFFFKEQLIGSPQGAGADSASGEPLLSLLKTLLSTLLILCLFFILRVVALRTYLKPYHEHLVSALFVRSASFYQATSDVALLDAIARAYALAVERNHRNNMVKSRWLKCTSLALTLALLLGGVVIVLARAREMK